MPAPTPHADYLRAVLQGFVPELETVQITEIPVADSITLLIRAPRRQSGIIIGTNGRTITILRSLMTVYSGAHAVSVSIAVAKSEDSPNAAPALAGS